MMGWEQGHLRLHASSLSLAAENIRNLDFFILFNIFGPVCKC